MLTREEIRQLFHLAEHENEQEIRIINFLRKEELSLEQKAKRLEFIVEHLNPRALIAVRQTDTFPENGIIKPTGGFLLNLSGMDIPGSPNKEKLIQDLQLRHPRITIHFTLNYPIKGVVSHGQWIEWNGKYAILIPVEDLINRVICLNPVDTWIIGSLELPSSAEILIKEEEYFSQAEVWHANAGKAKIIPCPDNLTIHEAVELRIKKKGYNLTEGGDRNWFETNDLRNIINFINSSPYLSVREKESLVRLCVTKGFTYWVKVFEELAEKYKKMSISHDRTIWRDIEKFAEGAYGLIFNPSTEERAAQNKTIILRLKGFHNTSSRYKNEVSELLKSQKYNNARETEYLSELINTLSKIEELLNKTIQKIELQRRENQTWEEFLREERFI